MNLVHASIFWLFLALLSSVAATLYQLYMLNVFLFFVLLNGGHELLHRSLFPRRYNLLNDVIGCVVYALFFHNFTLLRAAHFAHHECGRSTRPHCMLDRKYPFYTLGRYIEYYGALCGLNYWLYILGGVLAAAKPPLFTAYFFRISGRLRRSIIFNELICCVWAVIVWSQIPVWEMLAVHLAFGVMWGLSQNVAHYGLDVGESELDRIAARTYRVPRPLHFLLFGTPFSHLAHHLFPRVPGVLLEGEAILKATKEVLQRRPIELALRDFVMDLGRQFRSPNPSKFDSWYT